MNTDKKLLFIDLETTGLQPHKDRICQIGAILPDGKEIDWLINPECKIPEKTTEFHGITNEMVKDAPKFADVAEDLVKALEATDCFVAYNFMFDFQFLQYELHRNTGYKLKEQDFIFLDPYKIFKKMYPHTLSNAYKFYTGKDIENSHNAMVDIRCTKEVLEGQNQKYPDLFAQGLKHVEKETIGEISILGKWFTQKDNLIYFSQGKHKNEVVDMNKHHSYLQWIASLEDTTLSEKNYIDDLNKLPV